ncbi:MAG: hypothetical protein JO187_04665 [Acidobacteria bacterium]|nr:hypothetical protein [Acidobacteriota bacterium]
MRHVLMLGVVLAVMAALCIGSVAVPLCTPSKTILSLYPGCHQLVQPGQQDCFVAKVFEAYPAGGFGVVNEGIVFFIDENTRAVLGTSSLNSYGYAVGCFKIKSDVDVYAYFIGLLADGSPVLDTVAPLCSSYSNDIDVDAEINYALHGCGPGS